MSKPRDDREVLQYLEKVLESSVFIRSEQLSRFLRYLVERHLEGRDQELKESVIGVEVFKRNPDYNPKVDPIVRTEARRLRSRLDEYYAGEGKNDAFLIEVPKGGYTPSIGHIEIASARPGRRYWLAAALAGAAIVVVLAGWAGLKSKKSIRTTPEVYALYLRARSFEMQPATKGIEESIALFEQTIAQDTAFAQGYAGIAAGEAARSAFDRLDAHERATTIAKGWTALKKAAELDGSSPDTQDAFGMMQAREARWTEAEQSFRNAIQLAPRDILWRQHVAMFLLLPLGRVDEALTHLRAAEEMDPLAQGTHAALSLALRSAGQWEEADAHCQKAASSDQERGACWSQVLLRQGDTEQAVRIMETTWRDHLLDPGAQALGIAYARAGRRADAERIAALVPRPASKAAIYAALGDKDRTFEILNRMVPMGPTRIGRDVLASPNYALLKGDPRLTMLRQKLGLPE